MMKMKTERQRRRVEDLAMDTSKEKNEMSMS